MLPAVFLQRRISSKLDSFICHDRSNVKLVDGRGRGGSASLEFHRNDFGAARLLHGDPVKGVGRLHGYLVVGDEYEL